MKNLTQLSFDPPLLFHSFFLPFIPTTFFFFFLFASHASTRL